MNLIDQLGQAHKQFEIVGFDGDKVIVERLHELGLHQGSTVSLVGRASWWASYP